MHQIEQTIYKLPHIIEILKHKYPEEDIGDRLRIPFNQDGQLLSAGLSEPYKWIPWTPLKNGHRVPYQTNEYERNNFVFVQAMKVTSINRASYIRIEVNLEDINGKKYTMPIQRFKDHIDKIYGGWIVGQFKFIKHYGYRVEMVKDLWNEARQI